MNMIKNMSDEWNMGLYLAIFLILMALWVIYVLVIAYDEEKVINNSSPSYGIDLYDEKLGKNDAIMIKNCFKDK